MLCYSCFQMTSDKIENFCLEKIGHWLACSAMIVNNYLNQQYISASFQSAKRNKQTKENPEKQVYPEKNNNKKQNKTEIELLQSQQT